MIKELIDRWEQNKHLIEKELSKKHVEDYKELVTLVIKHIEGDDLVEHRLDSEKIHEIDDGSYQGTLIYLIPKRIYQPSTYYYVKVEYGSCSGCDTLAAIKGYKDEAPNNEQIEDYMMLALHIVQGIKMLEDDKE